MKFVRLFMVLAIGAVLLSGCRSSKHATDEGVDVSQIDAKSKKRNEKKKVEAMSAKLNLTLEAGNKKVNVGGTYRLKRNDVIQFNLTYTMIITINVGTMELTPDYILIVDRINKRYCKAAYTDIPELAQAGVDFDYLQRIFWGEAEKSPGKKLEWTYDDWTPLGEGRFPGQIKFTLRPQATTYTATFNLSSLRETADWETRTEVTSKYMPVSFAAIMNALMSVAK